MKYRVLLGKTPVEVIGWSYTDVIATGALEAMKIAMRGSTRYNWEVLSEKGDNVFSLGATSHFLVRFTDEQGGVVCVMPTTVQEIGAIEFPA